MKVIYVLYKGDEVIDIGTRRELAERLGVKEQTISFYASPSYRRRGKQTVVERVEVREEW